MDTQFLRERAAGFFKQERRDARRRHQREQSRPSVIEIRDRIVPRLSVAPFVALLSGGTLLVVQFLRERAAGVVQARETRCSPQAPP